MKVGDSYKITHKVVRRNPFLNKKFITITKVGDEIGYNYEGKPTGNLYVQTKEVFETLISEGCLILMPYADTKLGKYLLELEGGFKWKYQK